MISLAKLPFLSLSVTTPPAPTHYLRMKLSFKSLFHKKEEPLHAKKINQLSLDLKPIAEYRNVPINNPSPQKEHHQIHKSSSLQNVTNVFRSFKRSSSFKKLNRKHTRLNLISSIAEESCQTVKHHTSSLIDETSIFDNNSTSTSSYDISYAEIYNSLYPNHLSSSRSSISIISNKENIPPPKYSLSESQTPNYSFFQMTPKLTSTPVFENNNPFLENPFEDSADRSNPFIDNTFDYQYPHRSFKHTLKGPLRSQLSSSSSSSSSPSSLPSPSKGSGKALHVVNENLFKSSAKPISKLPKVPKSSPPKLPRSPRNLLNSPLFPTNFPKSPNSVNLLNYYNQLLHENSINENDVEEKSLFDALSNVECYDCSKITFVSYND